MNELESPLERLDRLKSRQQLATEARHVLWHFDAPGRPQVEPDKFTQALLEAFTRADDEQRARLHAGFPDYGMFCHIAKNVGLEQLEAMATAWESSRR